MNQRDKELLKRTEETFMKNLISKPVKVCAAIISAGVACLSVNSYSIGRMSAVF